MDLILYGTSYKTAPIGMREAYKFSPNEVMAFLPVLVGLDGICEAMVLSTCNRTEIYAVCGEEVGRSVLQTALSRFKATHGSLSNGHFYFSRGLDVVRHLFRVAAGLESQMVGENQIKGQVKDAYRFSCEAEVNGAYLNKLAHMAFKAAKDVRARTNLGAGAVSIASAAARLASNIYGGIGGRRILLIGAGRTGELVARYLMGRGIGSLSIANRTEESARQLAVSCGGAVVPFWSIADELFKNDIVISTTASPAYILTEEMIAEKAREAGPKKIMVVDIAVPRDIDPAISKYENIILYDMDDLETVVRQNIEQRRGEIPHAEEIVEAQVAEYAKWFREREAFEKENVSGRQDYNRFPRKPAGARSGGGSEIGDSTSFS